MLRDIAPRAGEYLDAAYHLFYEDLDVAWRAQRRGWLAWYTPQAVAVHQRGSTARQCRPRWPWLRRFAFAWLPAALQTSCLQNRYATIVKNDTGARWVRDLPWILAADAGLWTYCLLFRPLVLARILRGLPGRLRIAWRLRRRQENAWNT